MQDSAAFLEIENGMFHENQVIVEGSLKKIGFDLAAPGEKHYARDPAWVETPARFLTRF